MALESLSMGENFPVFVVSGRDIILKSGGAALSSADLDAFLSSVEVLDSFTEKDFSLSAVVLAPDAALPQDFERVAMRQFFHTHGETLSFKAARAKALANWRADVRFCSVCGTELADSSEFTARECPHCHKMFFPRIEPCVIVLVSWGDKILLARHVQRNQDIYACIAGFIESGESAEQAVVREIMEETGLTVRNVRYRGSQSWPFPDQLMLAFTAEYESGEIHLQPDEIADAQWFSRDDCPASPQPGSIAYKLIHNEI